jgi:hypothetical protein
MYLLLFSIILCIILILAILFIDPSPYIPSVKPVVKDLLYSFNPTNSSELAQYISSIPVELTNEEIEKPIARASGGNKNEERCRTIIESLYPGHKFDTVRPEWLKNPVTGRNLELDMYNHELKLALEYNGSQHIQRTKFHRTRGDLISQYRRDAYKNQRCKELGITLLSVPHWVKPLELEHFIKSGLQKLCVYPYKKLN